MWLHSQDGNLPRHPMPNDSFPVFMSPPGCELKRKATQPWNVFLKYI